MMSGSKRLAQFGASFLEMLLLIACVVLLSYSALNAVGVQSSEVFCVAAAHLEPGYTARTGLPVPSIGDLSSDCSVATASSGGTSSSSSSSSSFSSSSTSSSSSFSSSSSSSSSSYGSSSSWSGGSSSSDGWEED